MTACDGVWRRYDGGLYVPWTRSDRDAWHAAADDDDRLVPLFRCSNPHPNPLVSPA